MEAITVEELKTKTQDELISIIVEYQKEIIVEGSDKIHIVHTIDKLKESPSLQKHIDKIHEHYDHVSIMMFRVLNLENSDEIFSAQVSNKILSDITKLLKFYIRTTDILIKYSEQNFVIIASNTDDKGIAKYAKKLSNIINKNEVGSVSHLKLNFATTSFTKNDSINQTISKLYDSLIEIEKNNTKEIVQVK